MQNFIEPYNPGWPAEYERIKNIISAAVNNTIVDIQHVGSTSIAGLCAKPVLDIDIIITDKNQLFTITQKLQHLGYIARGDQGIPGRYAFRQASASTPLCTPTQHWQAHHLYVCYHDSLALKNHLLFRDALRGNSILMQQYAQAKTALAQTPGITREAYTKGKTEFILSILAGLGLTVAELNEIHKANS